ncbi:MAG: ABC transporter substrate-binding protein [Dehalococcoidia bacterium]
MAALAAAALGAGLAVGCRTGGGPGAGGAGRIGRRKRRRRAGRCPGRPDTAGLEKDHPLIAQYHWSKQTVSKNAPKAGGRLRIPMNDPNMWDPTDPSANNASTNWGYVYSRLLRPNTKLQDALAGKNNLFELVSEGDLAQSWEQPDDTTYVFKLRDNVTFHNFPPVNGRKMTAEDVVYSYTAYRQPQATAHVSLFRDVKAIEAVDATTVKITTNKPVAYLLASLTSPLPAVFAREAYERPGGLKPLPVIGTGPFTVKDYRARGSITMDKNPNYFITGRPYLDGVDHTFLADAAAGIAAFRTGQLDYLTVTGLDGLKQLQTTEGSNMDIHSNQQNSGGVQYHFGMKHDTAPWNDVRFRRALSLGLNREAHIAAIYQKGQYSLGFPTDWTSRPYKMANSDYGQWYKYDPAEAKKLLQAAGIPDGYKIKLQARTPGTVFADIAALTIEDWKKIGISLEFTPVDAVAFNGMYYSKQYTGMVMENFVTSGFDMDDYTYRILRTGEPANYYNVSDPELDNLVTEQQRVFDRKARQKLGDQVVSRDLDNIYRLWDISWYFIEAKRPYVQNVVSSDVYWWCFQWGSTAAIDCWFDK